MLGVPGSYSISVRDLDQDQGEVVKHYRIRNMDNGGYYISAKISFNTIKELVQHHSRTGGKGVLRVGSIYTRGLLTVE